METKQPSNREAGTLPLSYRRPLRNLLRQCLGAGTEFAKKLWGDRPYCLRFDDVTMFT